MFGLPEDVKFCKTCVTSNQRPTSAAEYRHVRASHKTGIGFDETGVCDACRVMESRSTIDWGQRESELHDLANRVRTSPQPFNVLVPGSGGKDSFYTAYLLKYKYGFRPLTITWAPHLYTEWGWRNFQRWIGAGFDNYLVTPNSQVHRLLTRLAFDNLLHPFQPFIMGQKSLVPRLARELGIQLIFYGENEADYGNDAEDSQVPHRKAKYFAVESLDDVVIGGVPLDDLHGSYGLTRADLAHYLPLTTQEVESHDLSVQYLGFYEPWHPQSLYYFAAENGGFEPSPTRNPGTYSKYGSLDDKLDDLHWYTTFVKFGIGHATFDASQEIRNGDITREEGVALVRRFDGERPTRFLNELLNYLTVDPRLGPGVRSQFTDPDMTEQLFDATVDSFRSPHLWFREGESWTLRHQVT